MPHKCPIKRKAYMKEQSRKHYERNRQKIIDKAKRSNDRERSAEYDKEFRRRKDPSLRILDYEKELKDGNISLDEFNRRIERLTNDIDEICRRESTLCEPTDSNSSEGTKGKS